jgi:hypothetical protein
MPILKFLNPTFYASLLGMIAVDQAAPSCTMGFLRRQLFHRREEVFFNQVNSLFKRFVLFVILIIAIDDVS